MPSIVNINKNYEVKNNNTSTQLSFDVGERFSGRIVSADTKTNIVQVRLPDGWQFEASIDKNFSELPEGVAKFEVKGFEGGKLKIKLVGRRTDNEASDDALRNFAASEGFSDDDLEIIKKMIGNKMDIFKDNILKAKSLLNFKADLNTDGRQEADFINKFIESRGIDVNSEEAGDIKKVLSKFFSQFKTMSDDDVLLFMKCNIDLNTENIKAFKEMLGADNRLYNLIKDMKVQIDSVLSEENISSTNMFNNPEVNPKNSFVDDINKDVESRKTSIDDTNKSTTQGVTKKENFNIAKSLISQMYNSNKSTQVSVLNLLKAMTGKSNDVLKYVLSNTLENYNLENGQKMSSEFVEKILNNISEDDILLEFTKNAAVEKNSIEDISKNAVSKSISDIFGVKIEVSDEQYKNIKNSIKFLMNEKYIDTNTDVFTKENVMDDVSKGIIRPDNDGMEADTKPQINNNFNDTKKLVKDAIKVRTNEIKDIIKDIIKKAGIENDVVSKRVLDIVKNSISEFKVFNSISNEYYYMDIPLKMREQEYPCKLIIKDDRKHGKQLDSTNLKFVVTVKTVSLGTIDSYVKVKNKNIDIEFKCDKNAVKVLYAGRHKLMDKLFDLGYTSNIVVTKKEEEVTLINCDKFFNENGKIQALDRMV